MKTGLIIPAILLLCPAADDPKSDAVKKEYARFDGTWKFESIEVDGKLMPNQNVEGFTLVLNGDQWSLVQGSVRRGGAYTVNLDKKPKQLDIIWTDGPEKGEKQLGIYELTKDTYKVCVGMPGIPRPTEFVSKPGSGRILEVLKREKRQNSK